MEKLTQKALMVVLTLFILVGMFFGLTTPVKPKTMATTSSGLPQGECPAYLCSAQR